jgi:hypothetical protein
MSTINPASDFLLTSPIMYVDVYRSSSQPSAPITLTPTNSGLMNLTVEKYIRGDVNTGRFSFTLAPGGPSGVNSPITWTSILTQYSLCVIYGGRGQSKAILMVGLISSITEEQNWSNNSVRRIINIKGFDLTLYFTTFAYYVLDYLGYTNTLPGNFGPAGSNSMLNGGTIQNSPDKVGVDWFVNTLVGHTGSSPVASPAVLQATYLTYQGNNIPLRNILTYWFEAYTTPANTPIIIPVLTNFLISQGRFYDKFVQIFPFPFYEFFINTVPHGYYPNATPPVVSISTQVPGFGTADVVTVGRVNPLPTADVNSSGNFILERSRWDALTQYSLAPYSFIDSKTEYNIDDIKNFFVISPMGEMTAPGGAPGNNLAPAIEQMGCMFDQQSIAKYGFRSEVDPLIWWVDPYDTILNSVPSTASGTTVPSTLQYESFLLKLASYYEAFPNMLYATVKIPMWPSIIVGNQFQYYPFKNNIQYTFYITGVEHNYNYGANSTTTLYLERGLPTSIYQDTPSGILLDVHLGQAERVNGTIVSASGIGLAYANIFAKDIFNSYPPVASLGSGILPSSTNNSYDTIFQSVTTACGSSIPWQTLKALAMTESTPALNNGAINSKAGITYYGIMQVGSNEGYNNTLLQTSPSYNIQAGATILCQKLQASGGSMLNALALYKGGTSYTDPNVQGPVNQVVQYSTNMGVSIIS